VLRGLLRRPLVLGTLVALVLAVSAGALVARLEGGGGGTPVEEDIHLTERDLDSQAVVPAGPSGGEVVPSSPRERLGGGLGSLADYRGKPLVLNVFSSSCAPCVKEMPALESVHQKLGDEVAIVGLALNDSTREAKALVERTGITYDVLRDPAGKLWEELGGTVMPTTFFISATGEVVDVHAGAASAATFEDLIEHKLLS
jgi:thiol-disulfide isomerase/thioredoxin